MRSAKKIFRVSLYFVVLATAPAVHAQSNLIITGTAPLLTDGTEVSLRQIVPKRLSDRKVIKVTKVKQHAFQFNLYEAGAELYYLSVGSHSRALFTLPGHANVLIADSLLKKVTVTENETNTAFEKYDTMLDGVTLFKEYGRARRAYDMYVHQPNTDSLAAGKKMQTRDSLQFLLNQQLCNIASNWIQQNPNSPINPYVAYTQAEYMPEDELKNLYRSMPDNLKKGTWANELQYRIDSLFVGGQAPDFSQPDTLGKMVKLSHFRGKYVLVDFWASWCVPCRAEIPDMVKVYQKLKNRDFTIVSISLDDDKKPWLNAIKHDMLNWTNVSSLLGWQNPVASQYYVTEIPDNYLLDPNGKIIAKDVHGAKLMSLLAEFFP